MRSLLKAYDSLLKRYPVASQAIQTGILVSAGDVISQVFVENHEKLNYKRTLQYFTIGAVYLGPAITVWYRVLDTYVGRSGKWYGLKKMVFDQTCFAPVALSGFLLSVDAIQGRSLTQIKESFKETYPDILMANYKLWPAVQLVNFYVVPLHYQVLYVQCFALFWNTYICFKTKPTDD